MKEIKPKTKVTDIMHDLKQHMSSKWCFGSTADFDMRENQQLAKDMKYITGFVRFLHTEEIKKLAYASLNAAELHLEKSIRHIRIWSLWIKSHSSVRQLEHLSIDMLAKHSKEPPTAEELEKTVDSIRTIKKAFEYDLMVGSNVNDGLSTYVADKMDETARSLKAATEWLQILVTYISEHSEKCEED